MPPLKVMVTGVYGLIAGAIYNHLQAMPERYDVYALARRREFSERVPQGRTLDIPEDKFVLSDLSDLAQVTEALRGMDVVVHMAADASGQRGWESLLASNIIGAYHILEGCRQAGVRRAILASSIQVSLGYRTVDYRQPIPEERCAEVLGNLPRVTHEWPVRPPTLYACTKVWAEALARYYADVHGLSCICLRIGWVTTDDRPPRPDVADIWCSQRDIVQLVERCINAPQEVRFDIFFGVSESRWRWVDIEHARQVVGYVPQDRAEERLDGKGG